MDAAATLESRLRAALSGSSLEEPRPLGGHIGPEGQQEHWLTPQRIDSLRPAAVLIAVYAGSEGWRMVLTRRADHLRAHSGQVSFPGGRRDPEDPDAIATALREAQEEIGLDPTLVEVIGFLDDYPTFTGFRVTPVVAVLRAAPQLAARVDEVAEIFEVPLEWLLDPRRYRRETITRNGITGSFYELDYQPQRIWGATAGMLWDLCCRLRPP